MTHIGRKTSSIFIALILLLAFIQVACAREMAGTQTVFSTPEEGVTALLQACKNDDVKALTAILGSQFKNFIGTSDAALDKQNRLDFYNQAEQRHVLKKENESRMTLIVGDTAWPFPIPMVKEKTGWRFDTAAGKDEIITRRIGEGELHAISICQAYVAAQRNYFSMDRNVDKVQEYAQKFMSAKGKRDGLYWEAYSEQDMSPLGPLVAESQEYLQGRKKGDPMYGYFFRILTAQGPNVPGGAYNYIINGHMIAGVALIAWPARYGSSGIMTFMVNQQGEIYEKNLGAGTSGIAGSIRVYNPDSSWKPVSEGLSKMPGK